MSVGSFESFLKAAEKDYHKCIPEVKLEKLKSILDHDVFSCSLLEAKAREAVPLVAANLEKFQKQWDDNLKEFILR